jgi:hypothetical protein
MPRLSRLVFLAPFLAGCGLGWIDNIEDRTEGLPTAGAGPYARLEIDDLSPALEPVVVADRTADLYDPSMLARDDGGFRVWFSRAVDNDPAVAEIYYAESPGPHDVPDVEPTRALAATEAWEEGRVSSPSVLVDDAGGYVMYYQAGAATPAIGVARSADGIAWTKEAAPVLVDATSPSAVIVNGQPWLFVTRPTYGGIWLAVDRGAGFVYDERPVVVPRPAAEKAFDRVRVFDPFALAEVKEGGMTLVKLWFAGTTDEPADRPAIGFTASFDGVYWPRFGGDKPMLIADATGPTVALTPTSGLMLFAEVNRGHLALTAAEHPGE